MQLANNYVFWFVTGSQHLYGPKTLEQVIDDSNNMVHGLNNDHTLAYPIVFKALLTTPDEITKILKEANNDSTCAGVIGWMHTFSPAKMWIKGLQALSKPFLHLHTQFNRDIPWDTIDMEFMNLNQSAHGDREFGFINTRLRMPRKVIVGYWEEERVIKEINEFLNVCVAISESKILKIARFGDNMRYVAVTEGDKVGVEVNFGWEVNGYGIGDLVAFVEEVSEEAVETLYAQYKQEYVIEDQSEESIASIKYQAKLEIAIENFLQKGQFGAFTTTFEDLHGLKQLPGLAVQRLMDKGYGFAGEGDWKTAGMTRLLKIMGKNGCKGTSFMEDYTYHMDPSDSMVLGAHMLEICPSIAEGPIKIVVKPLGIGGKDAPARFTFVCKVGPAINTSLIDMGGRLRLIINEVDAINAPCKMPNLPVAQVMWRPQPSLVEGAKAWILSGGSHHTVYTMDVSVQQLEDFAEFMDIETVLINNEMQVDGFRQALKMSDMLWNLKKL